MPRIQTFCTLHDQNSPAYGSDTDSSIENAMAAIKQSNETGNITLC